MTLNSNANARLMESAVNPSSNRFRVLTRLARRYTAGAVTVVASAVVSPASANTITFEMASFGAGFTGPVTEDGFTYSTFGGGLFINAFGNPGQDAEGTQTVGGGALKIVSATGGNFNFNALDFSAFDFSGTGSQTLRVEGFLGGSSVGVDQYTLANTAIFSPKYANWTTEAASVLAGQAISELDITLNAGLIFNESVDNVVLTPLQAAVPEPSSLPLLGVAVIGASSIWLRRRRRSTATNCRLDIDKFYN
jgi:PEP-CTERM motif